MSKQLDIPQLIKKYFFEYLTIQRGCSPHTITAYRDTFTLFLKYLQQYKRIKPERLSIDDISPTNVIGFLNELQKTRGNSDSTRNTRLAGLHSFIKYVLIDHPTLIGNLRGALAVPFKKTDKSILGYLSQEEINAILEAPDDQTWYGQRNRVLLTTMYNTGARVSEVIDLRVSDFRCEKNGNIHFWGKGRKERSVPLWQETIKMLRQWIDSNRYSKESLLFSNKKGTRLTRPTVAKMLSSTVEIAKKKCLTLKSTNVSPHTIRHTTAMHLLQAGNDITTISLWLGHESIETTHGYMSANDQLKEKALQSLKEPTAKEFRYKPTDSLLEMLENL